VPVSTYRRSDGAQVLAAKIASSELYDIAKWCHGQVEYSAETNPQTGVMVKNNPCIVIAVRKTAHINRETYERRARIGEWIVYDNMHGFYAVSDGVFKQAFNKIGN
jgi:hypothetical protein